ncbi:hypothetical protein FRB95_011014 [Tulasnella sp. JGI-2019a]|nr:hypothetical protein FRB95_011014 [Tulasnella sp. JGI-2019a]
MAHPSLDTSAASSDAPAPSIIPAPTTTKQPTHPIPPHRIASKTGPSPLRFSSTPSNDHHPSKRSFDQAIATSGSSQSNPQLPPMDVDPTPSFAIESSSTMLNPPNPMEPSPSPDPEEASRPASTRPRPAAALSPASKPGRPGLALAGLPKPYIPKPIASHPTVPPPESLANNAPPSKRARTVAAKVAGATRPATMERVIGTTTLPIARVQKIMRADKELTNAAKEAVFLVTVATEGFLKRITGAGYKHTSQEGRLTIQIKDLAAAAKQNEDLHFIEDIIPYTIRASAALPKALDKKRDQAEKEKEKPPKDGAGTITDAFSKVPKTTKLGGVKGGKGKGKATTVGASTPSSAGGAINGDGDTVMDTSGEAFGSASSTSGLTPSNDVLATHASGTVSGNRLLSGDEVHAS